MKKTNTLIYRIYFHLNEQFQGIYRNYDYHDNGNSDINSKFKLANEIILTKLKIYNSTTDYIQSEVMSIPIDFFNDAIYHLISSVYLTSKIILYFYDIPNDFQLEEHLSITEQINLPKEINFKKINNDLKNAYFTENILSKKLLKLFYESLDQNGRRVVNYNYASLSNLKLFDHLFLNLNNVDYDNIKPIKIEKII